ncbi:hypothetical protein ACIHCQ_14250 [Streptomyces sp. NPDC052236]|uniref:hypothetical protein n=1 Tax=Streptomyces sp. NPDC052236 TaxID=3365686 RepID=UPI0037CE1F2C
MTQTLLTSAPPVPGGGTGGARAVLRAVAIASCLPYLSLKAAWIAGSHIGVPEGSMLLEHRALMLVANSVTVVMDAAVIVLALLLTQPWGARVKGWLLAFPVWVATGLLTPIMVGFPLQLLAAAFGSAPARGSSGKEQFLDSWVYGVVYGGFIVQGLALGALFLLYARGRWSNLWRGSIWELPTAVTGTFARTTAVLGSLLALFPLVMHALWASGSTAGLPLDGIEERTADFYLLEGVRILFVLTAVAGALLLAFRRAPWLPVKTPLALSWVGSSVLAAWGGWLALASLMPAQDETEHATGLMTLTYSVEMIVGVLLCCGAAALLRRRSQ